MLYIEDFKKAYTLKKNIACIEEDIRKLDKELDEKEVQGFEEILGIDAEKEMLEYKLCILNGNLMEIIDFINGCKDVFVSRALYCKYLKNESWSKVAMSLGGYNSGDCIRKMVERYLDKKGVTRRKVAEKER